jgi:hypothetical protein
MFKEKRLHGMSSLEDSFLETRLLHEQQAVSTNVTHELGITLDDVVPPEEEIIKNDDSEEEIIEDDLQDDESEEAVPDDIEEIEKRNF